MKDDGAYTSSERSVNRYLRVGLLPEGMNFAGAVSELSMRGWPELLKREEKKRANSLNDHVRVTKSICNCCLLIGRYYLDSILVAAFIASRIEFVILR
jgi:hypothetical protein